MEACRWMPKHQAEVRVSFDELLIRRETFMMGPPGGYGVLGEEKKLPVHSTWSVLLFIVEMATPFTSAPLTWHRFGSEVIRGHGLAGRPLW